MRLVGTYRNINSSRQSSLIDLFFFFCSSPIFSENNKTSADVKTYFFALQAVRLIFSNVDLCVKSRLIALPVGY